MGLTVLARGPPEPCKVILVHAWWQAAARSSPLDWTDLGPLEMKERRGLGRRHGRPVGFLAGLGRCPCYSQKPELAVGLGGREWEWACDGVDTTYVASRDWPSVDSSGHRDREAGLTGR
ncbi:unnamed protein product, partial [Gadus morhua 'NCC']